MLRRKKMLLLTLILMCTLMFLACSKEQNDHQKAQKTPVTIEKTAYGTLEKSIPFGGLLTPIEEVTLASKNPAAKVASVPVQVGDAVNVGKALVIFDARDVDIQLNQAQLNHDRLSQLFEAGAIAKTQLEQAEVTLDTARLQKESLLLQSPINGLVSSLTAVEGQLAGSMPLVSVVNLERLKLEVQVSEAYINTLQVGDEMPVTILAASEDLYQGVITNIAPQVDSRSKAYPVTLEINNPEGRIKAGMYGEVKLTVDRREGILVIPQYALVDLGEKRVVFVVENDLAKMRVVQVGLALGDRAQILSGLTLGEDLVVEGQYGLKDGAPVVSMVRGETP